MGGCSSLHLCSSVTPMGPRCFFFAFSKTLLETRFRCILDQAPNFFLSLELLFFGGLETIIDGPQGKQSTRQTKKRRSILCFCKITHCLRFLLLGKGASYSMRVDLIT